MMPQFLFIFTALFLIHNEAQATNPQQAETCAGFENPENCQEAVHWLENILDPQTKIVTKDNQDKPKNLAQKIQFLDKHFITGSNPETTLNLMLSGEQINLLPDNTSENRYFFHLMVQMHMSDDTFSLLERVNKTVREEVREALRLTAEHNRDIKKIIGLSREELEEIANGPLTYKVGQMKKVQQNGREFYVAQVLFFPVLAQKLIENEFEISALGIESPEDYWVQYVMVKENNLIRLQDLLVAGIMLYDGELESIRSIARREKTLSDTNANLAQRIKLSKEEFSQFVSTLEEAKPPAKRSKILKDRLLELYQSYQNSSRRTHVPVGVQQ